MTNPTPPETTPTSETLHCYTDDTDTVVAESPADAIKAWEEYVGDKWDTERNGEWDLVPDDKKFKIWCDGAGNPDEHEADGAQLIERTAAEWASSRGRGWLCSTEY